MSHRSLSLLLLLPLIAVPLSSQADSRISFGIDTVPSAIWKTGSQNSRNPGYLDTSFDATRMTTYSGSATLEGLFSVGLSAQTEDQGMKKVRDVMGYLGYGDYTLRVRSGTLRGSSTWTGPAIPGLPTQNRFDNRYTNVDVLYWGVFGENFSLFYAGFGYSDYKIPVMVDTLSLNSAGDVVWNYPVYQPDLRIKTYSLLFGFDTLQAAVENRLPKNDPSYEVLNEGFSMWAYTQDRAGLGTLNMSDATVAAAEAANPGKTVKSNRLTAAIVDYELILGLQWIGDLGGPKVAIGAGYSFAGQAVMSFGGMARRSNELVLDTNPYLYRHGPVIKAMLSW